MCFGGGNIERDAETGAIPNVDKAFFHDGVGEAVDNLIPPVWLANGIFERDVVLRQRGGQVHMGGEADEAVEDAVRSDQDAVEVGIFGDPLSFRESADIFGVGADDVDGLFFDQVLEILAEVDFFSGVNGNGGTLR